MLSKRKIDNLIPDRMEVQIPPEAMPWLEANGYITDGEGSELFTDQSEVMAVSQVGKDMGILYRSGRVEAEDLADVCRREKLVPADMPDEVVLAFLDVIQQSVDFAAWALDLDKANRRLSRWR